MPKPSSRPVDPTVFAGDVAQPSAPGFFYAAVVAASRSEFRALRANSGHQFSQFLTQGFGIARRAGKRKHPLLLTYPRLVAQASRLT